MQLSPAFCLFIFTMAITPGPNNAMLLASGVNHGIRRSIPHFLGVNIGFTLMLLMIGFGLGSAFEAAPVLHQAIRIIGILYLCYLAWLIATTPTRNLETEPARPISFWQAALFQWVNPKAWIMITGAIATYTSPHLDLHPQILLLAAAFIVFGSPCGAVWLLGGAGLRQVLRNPKHQRMFNLTMAVLLVASVSPAIMELIRP